MNPESAEGGATSAVRQPLPELRVVSFTSGAMRAKTKTRGAPRRSGLSVLIVDDDIDGLQALGVLFRQAGLKVVLAGSADEAARSVEKSHPDVLISDLAMPGQDGFELLRRVRALERKFGTHVVAVAISAFSDPEMRGRAAAEGFEAYFVKPVDATKMLSLLAQLGFSGSRAAFASRSAVPPR